MDCLLYPQHGVYRPADDAVPPGIDFPLFFFDVILRVIIKSLLLVIVGAAMLFQNMNIRLVARSSIPPLRRAKRGGILCAT